MKIFATTTLLALAVSSTHAALPANVLAMVDTDVDPCDDFYQYTCGGWLKNYTLPANRTSYTFSIDGMKDRNEQVIQDILAEDWPLIGELWDSCMATDASNALGNKPLQENLNRIFSAKDVNSLMAVAGSISSTARAAALFTQIGRGTDVDDPTTAHVAVRAAEGLFPVPEYYEQYASQLREYISKMITLGGVDLARSHPTLDLAQAVEKVMVMESAFVAISPSYDDLFNIQSMPYSEAIVRFPLAVGALIDGSPLKQRTTITPSTKIVFAPVAYIERAEKLLSSTSLDDLKLYHAFLYVHALSTYLGDAFVTANWELFGKTLTGATTQPSRASVCTTAQIDFFPDLIGKYFFLKTFDVQRLENVQRMVDGIEAAMGEHIARLTWLDEKTRAEAATKLSKIVNMIGKSTKKKTYNFFLKRDNYASNVELLLSTEFGDLVANLPKKIDRNQWSMSAATVNAYYTPNRNNMVFPVAFLQPPFYSGIVHPAQNFGAIGSVMGHELTHAFDTLGRNFDGDGFMRNWWTPESAKEFDARAQCMIDQYNKFPAYGDSGEIVGYVNGEFSVGENIADNGGLNIAFDAYHNWLKSGAAFNDNGVALEEADKLFFISYGQQWCQEIRDQAAKDKLVSDWHAPKRSRANGAVMNSNHFANAFNCPVGSKMNPPEEEKCKLW